MHPGRLCRRAGGHGYRAVAAPSARDKELSVLATIAPRLPDPRAQKFVTHTREALLTQEVYQIFGGYADGNDAQVVRQDPQFQTLVDVSPDDERRLASGSTVNRFHHAYTRRQAEVPLEERPVLREVDAAQSQRLQIPNDYLPELFIRTRRKRPLYLILDIKIPGRTEADELLNPPYRAGWTL